MLFRSYFIANDTGFTIETGETNYQQQSNWQGTLVFNTPRVDMAISTDGGASFGNYVPYILNPIGYRKNKLIWWHGGIVNDLVHQFRFWGLGRFVITDGVVNVR